MIEIWKDAAEKARAIEMTDAAYREDSIAGLEAHYDKLRDLAPRLLRYIDRLEAENAELVEQNNTTLTSDVGFTCGFVEGSIYGSLTPDARASHPLRDKLAEWRALLPAMEALQKENADLRARLKALADLEATMVVR